MSQTLHAFRSALQKLRYHPSGGGAVERLALINPFEARGLRRAGGAGRMTKFGVPSFYMEGRGSTSPGRGSGATQSGQNAATHAAQSSGGRTTASSPQGQRGGPTGPAGGQGPRTGNYGTGGGGISTPMASGSPLNNPVRSTNLMNNTMQRYFSTSPASPLNPLNQDKQNLQHPVNPVTPGYHPGQSPLGNVPAEDLTRAAYDRSPQGLADQYRQYRSPPGQPPIRQAAGTLTQPYAHQPVSSLALQAQQAPATYSGPKGTTQLNDAARMAAARVQGYKGSLTHPSQQSVDALSRMMMAESGTIRNPLGNMSIPAMTGVGSVIQNRINSPAYPNTLQGVLTQKHQFSPTKAQLAAQTPNYAINDVARAILSGQQPSNVGTSLNYGNLNTIQNKPGYSSPATRAAFTSMNPAATFADAQNPTAFQHTFGTLGQPTAATQPTMVASVNPMAGPPETQTDTGPSLWQQYASNALQAAATSIDQNLVQPTKDQIAKYGGFKRAGERARRALALGYGRQGYGQRQRLPGAGEGGKPWYELLQQQANA